MEPYEHQALFAALRVERWAAPYRTERDARQPPANAFVMPPRCRPLLGVMMPQSRPCALSSAAQHCCCCSMGSRSQCPGTHEQVGCRTADIPAGRLDFESKIAGFYSKLC